MKQTKKGFTLVELVVVIVILSILATIWIVSFVWYASSARDSTRLSTIAMLYKWIDFFWITTWESVMPDDYIEIKAGSQVIWYQWVAWQNVLNTAKFNWKWKDPKDDNYYWYFLSANKSHVQILSLLENQTANQSTAKELIQQWFANEFANRIPYFTWKGLGMLVDENNLPLHLSGSVLSDGEFDTLTWSNVGKMFKSLFTNTQNYLLPSALVAGKIDVSGKNMKQISSDMCPEHFIPVPWNRELWQPDFCIWKYEASVAGWDKTSNFLTQPWVAPENLLELDRSTYSQCSWNGKWYHIMTLSQWLTIARNIEQQPQNWSSWIVWQWNIKTWNSGNTTTGFQTTTDNPYYTLSVNPVYTVNTWPTWNTANDDLRQLRLSNGEIIWDFVWNLWEVIKPVGMITDDDELVNLSSQDPFNFLDILSHTNYTDLTTLTSNNYAQYLWPQTGGAENSLWKYKESTSLLYFLVWWDYNESPWQNENGLFSMLRIASVSYANVWTRCAYTPYH